MTNAELITKFYTAFTNKDSDKMISCYHEEIVFVDPVFGTLKGNRVKNMWKMLLSKKDSDIIIRFHDVKTSENTASTHWIAQYAYSGTGRKVINNVTAKFKFKDGLIIEHVDTFDLWKWTQQALGPMGYLIGWSSFMQRKIKKTANLNLDKYIDIFDQ